MLYTYDANIRAIYSKAYLETFVEFVPYFGPHIKLDYEFDLMNFSYQIKDPNRNPLRLPLLAVYLDSI